MPTDIDHVAIPNPVAKLIHSGALRLSEVQVIMAWLPSVGTTRRHKLIGPFRTRDIAKQCGLTEGATRRAKTSLVVRGVFIEHALPGRPSVVELKCSHSPDEDTQTLPPDGGSKGTPTRPIGSVEEAPVHSTLPAHEGNQEDPSPPEGVSSRTRTHGSSTRSRSLSIKKPSTSARAREAKAKQLYQMFRSKQGSKGHDNIGELMQIRTMLQEGVPESTITRAITKVGGWAKHFGLVRWCISKMIREREEGTVESPVAADSPRAVGETSCEGRANAVAYRPVDPKLVAKWKALYPDEYDHAL